MYLKSEEVKKIDKYAIEKLGIPESILMENAGIGLKNNIDENVKDVCIFCGTGNNGGDGLVLARQLLSEEKNVEVFIIGNEEKLKNSVKLNYKILKNLNCSINFIEEEKDLVNLERYIIGADLIVDGIFGIGLSRNIEGIYKEVIKIINDSEKKVLAIDTPSGFNCSTGEIYNVCIKAFKTVTFIGNKFGFQKSGSKNYTGEVIVEQISIPLTTVKNILNNKFEK